MIILLLAGCAGYNTNEFIDRGVLPKESSYLIFPFRNPSLNGRTYSGVGSQFTQAFSRSSSKVGYDVSLASSRKFPSSKDLDLEEAIDYAQQKGADYFIVGYVSKWVDRATEWNGKRDFAGVSITAYDAFTGKLVRSVEMDQHSNNFYSGTPNSYVKSLSESAAIKLYQTNL